jgi:hypothetical protein
VAERSKKRRERIVPLGTQIVTRVDTHTPEGAVLQLAGAVAVILQMPVNSAGEYRVRFPDGEETSLTRSEFQVRKELARTRHLNFPPRVHMRATLRCTGKLQTGTSQIVLSPEPCRS